MMAAPMKNEYFDSIQTLLRLLNATEKKKIVAQKTCKGYNDLFKPWSHDGSEEDKEIKEKDKTEPVQTAEDNLSSAERTELELVNKLLSKAEKAYKVKEKLSESKRPNKDEPKSSSTTSKPNQEECRKQNTDGSNNEKEGPNIIPENKIRNDRVFSTDVKQKQNSRRSNNTRNLVNSSKPVAIETDKNRIPVKNTSRSRVENRRLGNPSLPHIKAPFQINPSIPFPKKSTSITKSVPQVRPSSSSKYRQTTKGQPPSRNMESSQKKGHSSGKKDPQSQNILDNWIEKENSNTRESVKKLSKDLEQDDVNVCQSNNSDSEQKYVDKEELIKDDKVDNRQDVVGDTNNKQMAELEIQDKKSEEKHKFNLLTDGCHLTFPAKLRKYVAHNRKLKQKYDMYRMTKKVNGIPAAEKIKDAIEKSFTDFEEWMLMKNVADMTNIYNNLRKYLGTLDIENISESSSVYELLRSRKALEMILSTFQQVEEQRSQLNTGCIDNADYIGACHVDVLTPSLYKPSIWLSDLTKDIWLPQSPPVLQYRDVRQLERYTTLVFQIQYCQFQCYIHEVFAKEILPFLKSVHPKSSEFVNLLRSSFSLLTDDETFPVVVRDTIQELEDSVIDDEC